MAIQWRLAGNKEDKEAVLHNMMWLDERISSQAAFMTPLPPPAVAEVRKNITRKYIPSISRKVRSVHQHISRVILAPIEQHRKERKKTKKHKKKNVSSDSGSKHHSKRSKKSRRKDVICSPVAELDVAEPCEPWMGEVAQVSSASRTSDFKKHSKKRSKHSKKSRHCGDSNRHHSKRSKKSRHRKGMNPVAPHHPINPDGGSDSAHPVAPSVDVAGPRESWGSGVSWTPSTSDDLATPFESVGISTTTASSDAMHSLTGSSLSCVGPSL